MKLGNKNLTKYEKYALIVIIIAIIIRFALISTYVVSGDACWHLSAARFMADNDFKIPLFEGVGRDEPFWPPPLFHFIAAFSYILFGELGLRIISPLFGSLTIILLYFLFRKLLNDKLAFYSIFFLSFIPLYIDYNVLGYVESLLTFLLVLSLYLALEGKYLSSGIIAGLSILTKYNGVFILPVLIFLAYKNSSKKNTLKNILMVSLLPLIIASPWLIRNWIHMSNPIWPFMNVVFHGLEQNSYMDFAASNLTTFGTYLVMYLGFFGVPDGNYETFQFVNIPYFAVFLAIYIIATILYLIPVFFGFRKTKHNKMWYVLLASYIPLFILYVSNVGAFVARMLMPAFLAFAFFYGIGIDFISKRSRLLGKLLFIIIILISTGFVGVEFYKFSLASKNWKVYQDDFDWIKSNTQKDDIILAGGQCTAYHLDRLTEWPEEENIEKVSYAFVNQEFKLDKRAIASPDVLEQIKNNGEIIYRNEKTGTEVYRIK